MSRESEPYHSASHCKYLTQYHIIWCPKFRYSVLKDGVEDSLKQILTSICERYNYTIKALEVMPDHIHIFVDCPQTVAPCDVARTLKSISAIEMFRAYPQLKKFYARCGKLWSAGYFVSSVGHISEAVVKKYIEEQKVPGKLNIEPNEYKRLLKAYHKKSDRHVVALLRAAYVNA